MQVLVELTGFVRDDGGRVGSTTNPLAFLAWLVVMYATDLLVVLPETAPVLTAGGVPGAVENVTDRTSNPFGMDPPCACECSGEVPAVFGYGDANADFHVIGDHPGVHGGTETGVPFTGSVAGERLQAVLHDVGFAALPYEDEPDYADLFVSYRHMCCTPDGEAPTERDYADLERFFDAELRAINAHVLLPVGERATDLVLEGYTAQRHRLDIDMISLHAAEIRGRGFMVIPVRDPGEWTEGDAESLREKLGAVLASDYRQTKGVATLVG